MLRFRSSLVPRTPWHILFAQMLTEFGSPAFDVQTEVELLRRPARADLVILRRKTPVRRGGARILQRLWAWLEDVAVVEFKSHSAPLAPGDLLCWLALAQLFWSLRVAKHRSTRVQAVLVVVKRTPTLSAEVTRAGLRLRDEGGGYLELLGAIPAAKIVVLDEVAHAERQPLLGLFSGATLNELPVQRWFHEHAGKVIENMGAKLTQANPDFLEAFIASLPAKRRLAGLEPKDIPTAFIASLPAKRRLAGLEPDEVARAVASLPAATRRAVMARLTGSSVKPAPRVRKRTARSKK